MRIEPGDARKLVDSLLQQIGAHGSGEYKAAELLRSRHRPVLKWLLGPSSPIRGMRTSTSPTPASSYLPACLMCCSEGRPCQGPPAQVENARTREMAITLYRSGEQNYGTHRWQEFLTLAANIFRTNNRWLPKTPVPLFYAAVDALARLRQRLTSMR